MCEGGKNVEPCYPCCDLFTHVASGNTFSESKNSMHVVQEGVKTTREQLTHDDTVKHNRYG
jgi:hypothetical protein